MNILKKVLLGSVFSVMGFLPLSVSAQSAANDEKPEAVLFKIHDVTPVEDAQGVISGCDFIITFYNRTKTGLKQAVLNLSYSDQVSEKYYSQENTNATDKKALSLKIDVPELSSYKQLMLKQHVDTDKCFLLLTDPQYNLSSCASVEKTQDAASEQATAQTTSRRASRTTRRTTTAGQNTATCPGQFEYVSPSNPEYYNEFKEISYEEQQRLLSDEKKVDLTELRETYGKVTRNLQEANTVINTIQ